MNNYLIYIGLAGFTPTTSLETLTTIIEHHLTKINYRNASIYEAGKKTISERQIPSLDVDDIFAFIMEHHGAYCFQHLELLYAALMAVGFNLERHLAQVTLAPPNTNVPVDTPNTHELLIVHLNNKKYIVDVGMCNQSLRKPLELREGEQTVDTDQYRLTRSDTRWSLDVNNAMSHHWMQLYQFFDRPVNSDEVRAAHQNMYLTPEKIPIRDDMLLVGKTNLEKRKYLIWQPNKPYRSFLFFYGKGLGTFKSVNNVGDEKTKTFTDINAVKSYAFKKFGCS